MSDKEISNELALNTTNPGVCERIKLLFTPFIDYESNDDTWTVTIVPESLRAYFYVEFWIFSLIGVILTKGFSTEFNPDDNIILNTFGNNNICVYYDDPPFSYIAAALFTPILLTGAVYIFVDINRVYFCMKDPSQPQITPRVYSYYKGTSIFIVVSFCYFVQVFVYVHWFPFGVLQWALFLLGIQHYIFMLKTKVISKDTNNYWIGIVYLVSMGIVVLCKFFLDLVNLFGGELWVHWGEWVKTFAHAIDILFMIIITICPIFIYFVFVTELDHVKFVIDDARCYTKKK
eukprot:406169_1